MCARRLSIRREGPERVEEKKRRRLRASFAKAGAHFFPLHRDPKHEYRGPHD
jgi:hypothetical protein